MFTIRPIELKDIDVVFNYVCQLAKRSGEKPTDFILTKKSLKKDLFGNSADWYGLVIENKEQVLGACLYSFINTNRAFNHTKCIFLDILFIDKNFRRKKLGHKLIDGLKSIAFNKGIERIEFWCMKDNIGSHKFYTTVGAIKNELFDVYTLQSN